MNNVIRTGVADETHYDDLTPEMSLAEKRRTRSVDLDVMINRLTPMAFNTGKFTSYSEQVGDDIRVHCYAVPQILMVKPDDKIKLFTLGGAEALCHAYALNQTFVYPGQWFTHVAARPLVYAGPILCVDYRGWER